MLFLCNLLGRLLSEPEVLGLLNSVALDMKPIFPGQIGQRQAFVEALESVFLSGAPVRRASEMITRDGAVLPVILSIAEIRGPYASDGAVVLVTRRS